MAKRTQKRHQFEITPPTQERFIVGDDNWQLSETQLPVGHEKVNTRPGDPQAMAGRQGFPVYDDTDTSFITRSRSNGKES